MLKHDQIIEKLSDRCGNQLELAALLGVDNTRLSKWKIVGIPPRHFAKLLRIAKERGVPLSLRTLDEGSPLTRDPAA